MYDSVDMESGYGEWIWRMDMENGYGGWIWWVDMVGGYGRVDMVGWI